MELNKILQSAASYAVLEGGKEHLLRVTPETTLPEVTASLAKTEECTQLLFRYGVSRVEYFPPFQDEFDRAKKGATLSCGELLSVANLLRAARIADTGIHTVPEETAPLMRELTQHLSYDARLEDDITTKILNDTELSDYASDNLYRIRREIRNLNERIRSKLSEYLSGDTAKYLQDGIVTMRGDRYVIPVKAEYKRSVKGFIHDRSATGATVFIEPEYVLELNNELVSLTIDEREEVEKILSELSRRVGTIADALQHDVAVLSELDSWYARAEYSYHIHGVRPVLNNRGIIDIQKGRHPLIDPKTVVPVSVSLGERYRFLLVSGPNTGGKTVTLKMVGLFCLMAQCGIFVPMAEGGKLSVYKKIFSDIGDAQSIEESLSTFSSHITNLISIVKELEADSLVLIDELGGGTDPEEGQALAKAIIERFLSVGASGIVTTHYTSLKEFAYATDGIENACMEFDSNSLKPLYRIKIGVPGSSNALAISRRLGLDEDILASAYANLSEGAQKFEQIIRNAEETRIAAQRSLEDTEALKAEWGEKVTLLEQEREKVAKEREKLFLTAKIESRRIINERVAEAEELLSEIEAIFAKEELTQADLIRARTLKNRLSDKQYESDESETVKPQYTPFDPVKAKAGDRVYVKSMSAEGVLVSVNARKNEVEVQCGSLKIRCKEDNLFTVTAIPQKKTTSSKKKAKSDTVTLVRKIEPNAMPKLEINVLGLTVSEAVVEIDAFLDQAVLSNLEEVKIVHGMGTGKLKKGIHEYLRTHRNVASFRLGKYGEGEAGVTIVALK